jgi:hypothetical protein
MTRAEILVALKLASEQRQMGAWNVQVRATALEAAISALESETREPWQECPSTHCERRQECASPNECSSKIKHPFSRSPSAMSEPSEPRLDEDDGDLLTIAYMQGAHSQHEKIRKARREALEEAAKVAVEAINSCRFDGESDLRTARARAEHAIRALITKET